MVYPIRRSFDQLPDTISYIRIMPPGF